MRENFPTPDDKLALIDLDGTLVDANYEVTDPGIYEAVEIAQANDWLVGLSSDTPYEALRIWRQRFKMNGPLIAEKGALIDYTGEPVYSKEDGQQYSVAYNNMRTYCADNGFVIWEGNPVEALRQKLQIGFPGDTVVLLNELRRCSLGLFVRQVDDDGQLRINEQLTTATVDSMRSLYPPFEDLTEDFNQDHGLLILVRAEITKRRGTQQIRQALGLGRVAMIGNSIADYVGSDIACHYAVRDATPEFRAAADYVANQSTTLGVSEILSALSGISE